MATLGVSGKVRLITLKANKIQFPNIVINRQKIYFISSTFAAATLAACIFSGNCVFEIRQLPGVSIAVVAMLCAIVIAASCLFALWFFVRLFGEFLRGRWVVPAKTGFIFASSFFAYFVFALFAAKKYCG
ncbi:hypothetical protein [Paraburkholderia dioscoreae]|uniref:Uncharacterized protein n=1 Tax=Paraburkholderia dioscoreae TaxID=2604047 RepID=A0A5Q4YX01_9BURK|nr:hypothetical protein [Paraburkholderia dioscoreae]VVD34487.1 membrane protein of unknown function [Paraburkholderia dioscoreae]